MLSVVEEICLGLYTTIVYLILSAKAKATPPPHPTSKTQRLGPQWQCGRMQTISPSNLSRAPQESPEAYPASIYTPTEFHVL